MLDISFEPDLLFADFDWSFFDVGFEPDLLFEEFESSSVDVRSEADLLCACPEACVHGAKISVSSFTGFAAAVPVAGFADRGVKKFVI